MKLTLNTAEVQEAVSNYIVTNGFPVDMTNASITISDEGADISFDKIEETTAPTAPAKPKAKRSAPKAAAKEKVELAVMPEPETVEEATEEPAEDLFGADVAEEASDLVLDELNEDTTAPSTVSNDEPFNNEFSLFANA